MNCKNCKYFSIGGADLIGNPEGIGKCNNYLLADDYKKDTDCAINGLLATCDESMGELFVGEEFGCIHFEQKIL